MPTKKQVIDQDAIRELELYIENDSHLFHSKIEPIRKNLMTKIGQGKYDSAKAAKIFKYLIEDGIKKYNKEFEDGISLNTISRKELMNSMEKEFYASAKTGEYDEYLPKKYKKAARVAAKASKTSGQAEKLKSIIANDKLPEGVRNSAKNQLDELAGKDKKPAKIDYEKIEFTVPEWALSYLINNDGSGLEEEDIEKLNKFSNKVLEQYGSAHFSTVSEESEGFQRSNDVDNLGSDVWTVAILADKKHIKNSYKIRNATGIESELEKFLHNRPGIGKYSKNNSDVFFVELSDGELHSVKEFIKDADKNGNVYITDIVNSVVFDNKDNKNKKPDMTKKSATETAKEKSKTKKVKKVTDWKKDALKKLKEETDNDDLVIEDSEEYEFTASSGNTDYRVFKTEKDAEIAAEDYVKDMLDDEPENFSQDWLQNHIYITDTDRRIIAGEDADSRLDGMSDEDIIEEAGDFSVSDWEEEENEKKKDKMVETSRSTLETKWYDESYEAMADPIQHFVKDQGMYNMEDLMKANFIRIDTKEAAADAVATDGVAHFLSGYDGKEIELAGGYYAYRTN